MHITEKRIEVMAPIERVFDLFSDFESFPRWMQNIKVVRYTGRRFTRWAAAAPLGMEVEWEAETIAFEPDRRIAWRSVRGDVETEGEVVFEATRRGTTLMRVVLGYALPAGRLGEMVARLFGTNPDRQLADDLERFAAVAEGRRSRGARRETGENGRQADAEESEARRRAEARGRMIGPRGERRPRSINTEHREPQFDERYLEDRPDRRERDYHAGSGERTVPEESMPRRERDARDEFAEALRAARRSQIASQRLYAAEREDYEQRYNEERDYERVPRRFEDERENRLPTGGERFGPGERGETKRRRELAERYQEEPYPRPHRYALTPREREQPRRRDLDEGYSEEAFRRGVDKLMDDAPSRRWRR